MRLVCEWEHTARFGQVGKAQSTGAHVARGMEYFSDAYEDSAEALYKAERFLAICDYLARNQEVFSREGMIEKEGDGAYAVDPGLVRSAHRRFTAGARGASAEPDKVLFPAKAFKALDPAAAAAGSCEDQL